ncbi:MAG: cytochrome c maturation protein CcmE domain-containing protein, partial [Planctomycetota bacterium]
MSHVRMKLIAAAVAIGIAVTFLAVAGIREGWVYYLPVDEFVAGEAYHDQRVRLHGLVAADDLEVSSALLVARFNLMGDEQHVRVEYEGVIPDMFQADREVVVEGRLDETGVFKADTLLTAVLASVASVRFRSPGLLRSARWLLALVPIMLTATTAALIAALINSDFRFEYVAGYTERALPFGYKLAALWAGQEGSLLLWAWLLAILCMIAAVGWKRLVGTEHAVAVAAMALVCGFFAVLLLFAANPFQPIGGVAPPDGRGLNPMLQDPAMIIHPPLLFMGYAGFTVPFALTIGVLVAGRRDNRWIALIRRWLLVSWLFLGAGIVLGAWWAYVELGWGGYWAWDPVENASLLPWLTSTALLHSIMVRQHRGMFKRWNVSLMFLTFILCIFGTYLTRSGVIDSVHA